MKESLIQSACLNYLAVREKMGDLYAIRNNSFAGNVVQPNGHSSFINNAKPGSPDAIVLYKGKYLAIEFKNEQGRQSRFQQAAQSQIEQCGGIYAIIRSVEELEALLKKISKLVTT